MHIISQDTKIKNLIIIPLNMPPFIRLNHSSNYGEDDIGRGHLIRWTKEAIYHYQITMVLMEVVKG